MVQFQAVFHDINHKILHRQQIEVSFSKDGEGIISDLDLPEGIGKDVYRIHAYARNIPLDFYPDVKSDLVIRLPEGSEIQHAGIFFYEGDEPIETND